MSKKVGFVYSPAYEQYSFGSSHPFNSKRLALTLDLMEKAVRGMLLVVGHD